jgi:hypothetical protein
MPFVEARSIAVGDESTSTKVVCGGADPTAKLRHHGNGTLKIETSHAVQVENGIPPKPLNLHVLTFLILPLLSPRKWLEFLPFPLSLHCHQKGSLI